MEKNGQNRYTRRNSKPYVKIQGYLLSFPPFLKAGNVKHFWIMSLPAVWNQSFKKRKGKLHLFMNPTEPTTNENRQIAHFHPVTFTAGATDGGRLPPASRLPPPVSHRSDDVRRRWSSIVSAWRRLWRSPSSFSNRSDSYGGESLSDKEQPPERWRQWSKDQTLN